MKRNSQTEFIWDEIRNPDCQACILCKEAQTVCLLGDGPVPADGMVIGEAPGYREDEVEIPFAGKSGIFLRRTLKEIGLDPRTLYITNTVACRPPGNRAPTRKEAKTCSALYLDPQIDAVKPRVILLLGNTAVAFVTGRKATVTKLEGTTLSYKGIPCIPCRHPSSVVRAEELPDYGFLVQKFKENLIFFRNTLHPKEDEFKFKSTIKLDETKPIFTDIETNGLNPFRPEAKIHSAVIVQNGDEIPTCFKISELKRPVMGDIYRQYPIIAHRAMFEGTWIRRTYGITPKIYYDTKLGALLQNENEPTGLKYQCVKYLSVDPWSEEMDWENPDFKKLLPYNARDGVYMKDLYYKRDIPFLKKNPKVARLLRYILLPAIEVFIEVVCNGFHIDMAMAKKKLKECEAEMSQLNKKLNAIADKEVNPGSPKQMTNLLYNQLRLKCPVKTAKGAKSSSEAALIRLAGQHPAVDILTSWREQQKNSSTYLSPWIEKGPILHANYGFTDTDTGRLNSTMVKNKRHEKGMGATLHQIPRDPYIRNVVTPRNKNWCILEGDTSQGELRFVAHASGDKAMIDIYHHDSDTPEGDIHYQTARTLQPHGEILKETRKKAKAVNFGFVYGMFAKKFVIYAFEKFGVKLTLTEGEEYREKFFDKYKGLIPWHNRIEAFVTKNGFIDSVFGRRRHLPDAMISIAEPCPDCAGKEPDFKCFLCGGTGEIGGPEEKEEWIRREAVRQAINSPIQSANSDLTLWIAALIGSRSLKWDFKINPKWCLPIGSAHDSLLFEAHRDYVKEMITGIKWTVENLPWGIFGVKLRVPVKMDLTAYEDRWKGKVLSV